MKIKHIEEDLIEEIDAPKRRRRTNRQFLLITYSMMTLLLVMAGYFCYFLYFKSENFINNSYNQRLSSLSAQNIRGDIITIDGVLLAHTDEKTGERIYPEGRKYAHAVGFDSHGMMGLEKEKNFSLLRSHAFILTRIKNEIFEEKNMGDTLVSSIDSRLQEKAYDLLGNYKGAVVMMEPSTGRVLAMVSKGDFDPNTIQNEWESISNSSTSILLNRAMQGLYPPGSVFKIVTALEYLKEGGKSDDVFTCQGQYTYEGNNIHCYHNAVHGEITLEEAFAHSCNCVFAQLAQKLDEKSLKDLAERLYFNTTIPCDYSSISKSSFNMTRDSGSHLKMQTVIGQGNTLSTPIHMAMIAASIANDGVMVQPRLADRMENEDGNLVMRYRTKKIGQVLKDNEVDILKKLMSDVVEYGTASSLKNDSYRVYGKTGSAEFNDNTNDSHSWFVGFADNDDKQAAIAVIMEAAGSGSEFAVPAARELFDVYYSN